MREEAAEMNQEAPSIGFSASKIGNQSSPEQLRADENLTAALKSETQTIADTPLEKYVARRTANALAKLGLYTVEDLLLHVPFRLAKRGELMPIEQVSAGQTVTVVARVIDAQIRPMHARRGFILHVMITDGAHDLALTFFAKNQRPLQFHAAKLQSGNIATFSGTISAYRGQLQLQHPDYEVLADETQLDAAAIAAPIPIYHASAKLPSWQLARAVAAVLPLVNERTFPEILPADYLATHGLPARASALRSLHQPESEAKWQEARERMAHEEAFVLQTLLAKRAKQAAKYGACPAPVQPNKALAYFDQHLPFSLTAGQEAVGRQIAADLAQNVPMRRLLQGDVGTGKTVVALRAMLQVIDNGKQAVLLAPTEVLAQQHYTSITAALGELAWGGTIGTPPEAVSIEVLTGSLTPAQKKQAYLRIAAGQAQLIIGTHALLEEKVQLPFLGLVVVDEQHRFGVDQRDKLAVGAHTLVMSATPIPRTLAMTVFGDLEVSTLRELPKGRKPISTTLVPAWNEAWMRRIWQRASEEIARGGRVYVVCPRIYDHANAEHLDPANNLESDDERIDLKQSLDLPFAQFGTDPDRELVSVEQLFQQLLVNPDLYNAKIAMLHGRLSAQEKTQVMRDFQSGKVNLLISTTVIEVGVDVPEATMMVIMDADRFGLSQLHQLRGRIGRGGADAICLAVHHAPEGTLALERLTAFATMHDGFELAEEDLRLRNVGNVLGKEQSGVQSSLRFLNIERDLEIITTARESAGALVTQDPDLIHHRHLAQAVEKIAAQSNTEYLVKN